MKCKVFSGKDRVSGISVAKKQYSANKDGVFDLPTAVVNEIGDKFRLEPVASAPAPAPAAATPAQKKNADKGTATPPADAPQAPAGDATGNAPEAPQGPTPPPEK